MSRASWIKLALFAAFVLALVAFQTVRGSGAPKPPAFAAADAPANLDEAIAKSASTGKPVFALATADWCPPCQSLKRDALNDQRITQFLTERTVPLYLDVTNANGPSTADAQRLEVRSIPAMYIIQDGHITAQLRGAASAEDLLRWLQTNS